MKQGNLLTETNNRIYKIKAFIQNKKEFNCEEITIGCNMRKLVHNNLFGAINIVPSSTNCQCLTRQLTQILHTGDTESLDVCE